MSDFDWEQYWDERLTFLLSMSEKERRLFFIAENGRDEVEKMESLIAEYADWGHQIERVKALAKQAVLDYNQDKDDESLGRVETYTSAIVTFTEHRSVLRQEIKKSREMVRWLRGKYKEVMQLKS